MFEYSTPMMHPDSNTFYQVHPDDYDDHNPWKDSFRQLVNDVLFIGSWNCQTVSSIFIVILVIFSFCIL